MKARIALLLLLGACSEPVTHEVIRPVRVHTVERPEDARRRTFSGTAKASQESMLSFRVGGKIVLLAVDVGDAVVKGELLAQLDPLDFQLEMEKAQAELARAQARSRNAQANYDRVRSLYETRTASKTDLDNARAESEAGIANVASANKALALAERQLEYTTLQALTDGAIAAKLAEVKENVQPGEPVLQMVAGTAPEVDIQVPETMISYVQRGQPVEVRFSALGDEILGGRVIRIGVATTGTATTYPVTLLVDDPDHKVRSGMTAEVIFTIAYGPDIVRIPAVAVGGDLEGSYVYLVDSADGRRGTIIRQPVAVGELIGDEMVILDGLDGGERVVTAGLRYLQPGEEVLIYKGKPYGIDE